MRISIEIISLFPQANLAQLVEHFIRNERVVSSNLIVGSAPAIILVSYCRLYLQVSQNALIGKESNNPTKRGVFIFIHFV